MADAYSSGGEYDDDFDQVDYRCVRSGLGRAPAPPGRRCAARRSPPSACSTRAQRVLNDATRVCGCIIPLCRRACATACALAWPAVCRAPAKPLQLGAPPAPLQHDTAPYQDTSSGTHGGLQGWGCAVQRVRLVKGWGATLHASFCCHAMLSTSPYPPGRPPTPHVDARVMPAGCPSAGYSLSVQAGKRKEPEVRAGFGAGGHTRCLGWVAGVAPHHSPLPSPPPPTYVHTRAYTATVHPHAWRSTPLPLHTHTYHTTRGAHRPFPPFRLQYGGQDQYQATAPAPAYGQQQQYADQQYQGPAPLATVPYDAYGPPAPKRQASTPGDSYAPSPPLAGAPAAASGPSCNCGVPAALRTSNSERNPGRQFYKCSKLPDACKYFQWADEPPKANGGGGAYGAPGGGGAVAYGPGAPYGSAPSGPYGGGSSSYGGGGAGVSNPYAPQAGVGGAYGSYAGSQPAAAPPGAVQPGGGPYGSTSGSGAYGYATPAGNAENPYGASAAAGGQGTKPVQCLCGIDCPVKTSNSANNPGERPPRGMPVFSLCPGAGVGRPQTQARLMGNPRVARLHAALFGVCLLGLSPRAARPSPDECRACVRACDRAHRGPQAASSLRAPRSARTPPAAASSSGPTSPRAAAAAGPAVAARPAAARATSATSANRRVGGPQAVWRCSCGGGGRIKQPSHASSRKLTWPGGGCHGPHA